jgi:hypothetical protein
MGMKAKATPGAASSKVPPERERQARAIRESVFTPDVYRQAVESAVLRTEAGGVEDRPWLLDFLPGGKCSHHRPALGEDLCRRIDQWG